MKSLRKVCYDGFSEMQLGHWIPTTELPQLALLIPP